MIFTKIPSISLFRVNLDFMLLHNLYCAISVEISILKAQIELDLQHSFIA